MRFSKIRVNDKGVQLLWTTTDANGTTTTHDLTSAEKPTPDLPEALDAFREYVMDLLELPAKWRDQIRITTLSISDDKETNTRGLMVSATKKIAKASGRPLSITTPHMREGAEDSTAKTGILEEEILELIAKAETAASRFVKGERAQGEIFPSDASAPPAAGAEGGEGGAPPAAGEDDVSKARKRRPARNAGTPGEVWNPDSTKPPTDEQLRKLCLQAGRDVPIDAIARWTSIERDRVQKWATDQLNPDMKAENRSEEPETLKKEATPALLEDVAKARDDGWTQETPPPKAADVKPVAAN